MNDIVPYIRLRDLTPLGPELGIGESHKLFQLVAKETISDRDVAQRVFMFMAYRYGMRQYDIARTLRISRQRVFQVIHKALEQKQYRDIILPRHQMISRMRALTIIKSVAFENLPPYSHFIVPEVRVALLKLVGVKNEYVPYTNDHHFFENVIVGENGPDSKMTIEEILEERDPGVIDRYKLALKKGVENV